MQKYAAEKRLRIPAKTSTAISMINLTTAAGVYWIRARFAGKSPKETSIQNIFGTYFVHPDYQVSYKFIAISNLLLVNYQSATN